LYLIARFFNRNPKPQTQLPNSESFFYWERVKFGLKPTLRMNVTGKLHPVGDAMKWMYVDYS